MNYLDTGFNARMEVLQGEINNHIKPLLDGHGWTWEIESTHKEGDGFLIIKIEKNSVIKRFGIIYGQQVSKSIYSYIQNVADACLIYGMTFDANCSFSRDFTKPKHKHYIKRKTRCNNKTHRISNKRQRRN